MLFPEDAELDDEARREFREEWLEIAEDEQIAEGDISVSETVSGKDPLPDLDDEGMDDALDEIIAEEDLE